MKKILALILAVLMVASIFAGCGSNETPTTTEAPAVNNEAPETQGAETPKEVPTLKYTTSDGTPSPNDAGVAAALSEYTSETYGFNVTFDRHDGKNWPLRFAESGEGIDDVMTYQNGYLEYANSGAFLDLTDYIANSDIIKENVPAALLEAMYVDGKIYGIPVVKEMATGTGVLLRQKDVDKYGWDLSKVKSYADLEPLLEDIFNDPDTPVTIGFSGNWGAPLSDYGFVNYITRPQEPWVTIPGSDEPYKIKNTLETEHTREFLEMYYNWKLKGYIPDNAYGSDWNTAYGNALANGTVGIIQWTGMPEGTNTAEQWYPNQGELVEVMFSDPMLTTYNMYVSVISINAKTAHPEEAFKFVEMINSDQTARNFIDYGIEGENYVIDANGRVEKTDTESYKREAWRVANVLIPTLTNSDSADKVELYEAFNASAKPQQTFGFMPDYTNVSAEVAAVTAVWKTYSEAIWSGTANPAETLDIVIQEMNAAGAQKIIAELQAQLDAWLASK